MVIDVLDSVTKTPKLIHAVKRSYQMLEQVQHTVVIKHKKLVERITAYRAAPVSLLAGVPSIPPDSASAMDVQDKNLEGTFWLFHGILDYYLNDDGLLEILLSWKMNYEAPWEPCKDTGKEEIFRCFPVWVGQFRADSNNHQE